MKKFLLAFFAVILAVGMSAFNYDNKSTSEAYDWVSATNPNNKIFGKTRTEAISHYGCNLGASVCAYAFEEDTQVPVSAMNLKFN
ncbi:MAG: DUF6520 family protein [Chitinophagaceae bacterium]